MKLYNSLTKKFEEIVPNKKGVVSIYSCGPTVYWRMQVGNLRSYAEWDVLHRALLYLGYRVERVMNFTDVGHMTEDDDFGEDKIEKEAKSEGLDPWEISEKYIKTVLEDFHTMNFLSPSGEVLPPATPLEDLKNHNWVRATEYVDEMIDFVKKIEANGYTYETDQAVYFDISKYPDYTKFFGQALEDKKVAVRDEVEVDLNKRHPADFVLWMKRIGKYKDHIMHWDSPWGPGFPGWHIECSAMGCNILGEKFDIHTGGTDLMPVHHANEIAQNYGAYNHDVVRYWVHNEFVTTPKGEKLSKSKGNAVDLDDVIEKGFGPMDLRYHFVSVNYRVPMKFSWKVLESSRRSRLSMLKKIKSLNFQKADGVLLEEYVERFKNLLMDNLNMSGVLALISELLKSDERSEDIVKTILDFDKVLGVCISESLQEESEVSAEVQDLLEQREKARLEQDYEKSDSLRDEIAKLGFKVMDTEKGQELERL